MRTKHAWAVGHRNQESVSVCHSAAVTRTSVYALARACEDASGNRVVQLVSLRRTFVSNVVSFLERAGQDAQLRYASAEQLTDALASAHIEPQAQAAILGADARLLESVLGATPNVCCVVQAPQDDEPEPADDEPQDKEARSLLTMA